MSKRVNIMLPETTLGVLCRVTTKGNRSRFVSRAVLRYVREQGKWSLREQLKAGYQANADDFSRSGKMEAQKTLPEGRGAALAAGG